MKTRLFRTRGQLIGGVMASLVLAAPMISGAAEATTPVSRQVSYAGIDLSTPEGASALYVRLKGAARALCNTSDPVHVGPSWVYRECIEDALAGALRKVNRPLLSQAFVSDYGSEAAAKFGVDSGIRVARK